jgi:hypothetical protein
MQIRIRAFFILGLALFGLLVIASGCGSSGNANIRFVNVTPDESSLDFLVNGTSLATGVSYGTTSGYKSVSPGSQHLQVEATGTTTPIIDTTTTASSGAYLSLFSLNYSFAISNVILTDDNSAPASGDFKLRIVNASPGLGPQDVYIQPAGTDISTVSPTVSSLGFGAASGYSALAAGNYEVSFTPPGQKFVNVDSGSISFSGGQIRTGLALNTEQTYGWEMLSDLN